MLTITAELAAAIRNAIGNGIVDGAWEVSGTDLDTATANVLDVLKEQAAD